MNFVSPGTRLDLRLTYDNTPKKVSEPVDRVNVSADHCDLAFAKHSDTINRNVADRIIFIELDFSNPTMREKEIAMIKPIIMTKK